jgi:hypothetical protein
MIPYLQMLSDEDRARIAYVAAETSAYLEKHYAPGFGVFPSSDPDSNYYNQVWARDFAHASGNYFTEKNPQAVMDSLETILKHQKPTGELPSRVEREYQLLKFVPVIRRWSKPLFNFFETRAHGRSERPVYEGVDTAGGEDTIPSILIAAGGLFFSSEAGERFGREHFEHLRRAADFFAERTDPEDGLAVMTRVNPDWVDTVKRYGKLGTVNVWWARGLEFMAQMATAMDQDDLAEKYSEMFKRVRESIMEEVYNEEGAYFRAEVGGNRLDTVATIFGTLYFLGPDDAVRVEETLDKRVRHKSGLQNFDPPYPISDIFWLHRYLGQWRYHNEYVWPWVTAQNIFIKLMIGVRHKDAAVREKYKEQAVRDLALLAKIFKETGAAYEVLHADTPIAPHTFFYRVPQRFMGSMVAYQGAYLRMKKLGWV